MRQAPGIKAGSWYASQSGYIRHEFMTSGAHVASSLSASLRESSATEAESHRLLAGPRFVPRPADPLSHPTDREFAHPDRRPPYERDGGSRR